MTSLPKWLATRPTKAWNLGRSCVAKPCKGVEWKHTHKTEWKLWPRKHKWRITVFWFEFEYCVVYWERFEDVFHLLSYFHILPFGSLCWMACFHFCSETTSRQSRWTECNAAHALLGRNTLNVKVSVWNLKLCLCLSVSSFAAALKLEDFRLTPSWTTWGEKMDLTNLTPKTVFLKMIGGSLGDKLGSSCLILRHWELQQQTHCKHKK